MAQVPGDVPPLDQGIFFVHLNRARKHFREERIDLARQELELAQLSRPNDEDVLNLLSVIEYKRGYYHEAARAVRALLKDNLNSAVLHCNLGLILFKAGVLGEAEQKLRRAVELKPDHPRSHLYLGLLYRMRGKLGLAVEHLRFAGAKKLVAEIEESLRRPAREGLPPSAALEPAAPARPAAREAAARAPVSPAPPAPVPALTLAEPEIPTAAFRTAPAMGPVTRPSVAVMRASPSFPPDEKTGRISVSTVPPSELSDLLPRETAPEREARPSGRETEGRPLFRVRADGGLEIASRGVVFVRKGSVVWYSGKIRFAAEPAFRGTRLEKILRADGRGYLFVNDPGRQAFRRDLDAQSLYLEGSRVLALDHGLSFRLEPIHDFRMNRRVDILKIQGRGSVILSVGGPLLAHQVSSEFPLNVSSRDLVAWTGDLVPSVLEDRFLEEVMMPDAGSAPKIRFEGTGTVLTEPPRPRRRASDLAPPSATDRRS